MTALNWMRDPTAETTSAKRARLKPPPSLAGKTVGLKGGVIGAEVSAPLIGVGYIIGPRIASIMVAGGVLAYLVLVPLIKFFGDSFLLRVHFLSPQLPGGLA